MESNKSGLCLKYNVRKIEDGSLVNNCFVLRPDHDMAARAALLAYAQFTDNKVLAGDIRAWLNMLQLPQGATQSEPTPIDKVVRHLSQDGPQQEPMSRYELIRNMTLEEMVRNLVPLVQSICGDGEPGPELMRMLLLDPPHEDEYEF